MHPLDCLLYGGQVVDIVGLGELQALCFGGDSGGPLPLLPLVQWDAVSAFVVSDANYNGLAFAGDKGVFFLVDCDVVFCEDGYDSVVVDLSNTHE